MTITKARGKPKAHPDLFLDALVRREYDRIAKAKRAWDRETVVKAVLAAAGTHKLQDDLLQRATVAAVDRYDDAAQSRIGGVNLNLFTKNPDYLDAVLPLGNRQRLKFRYMGLPELDKWYSLQVRNFTGQVNRFNEIQRLFDALRPYLAKGGNVEDAQGAMAREETVESYAPSV